MRNQRGGQAPVGNASMAPMSAQQLAQGGDYLALHKGQYGGSSCGAPMQRGGAAVSLAAAAPVGYTGMLDDSLRGVARVGPLDQSIGAIQGMRDQSGGARRKRGGAAAARKAIAAARRATKRARQTLAKLFRRMRKATRQRGGAAGLSPADYGAPGALLSGADQVKAMMGQNPEWRLAADPAAFAPK
jgi:hypothetical protein